MVWQAIRFSHALIHNYVPAPAHLKLAEKRWGVRILELRDLISAEEAKFM